MIGVSNADSDLGFNEFGDWFSNRQPATSSVADSNLLFQNGNSRIGGRVVDRIGFR